ncbi:MAG: peptidylprolyl isomerase [Candidatus Marinimicrobia bacterium]|nr:peptidylprolyl isomerase [Candidatus Neomarinimicrobiota bacterium]
MRVIRKSVLVVSPTVHFSHVTPFFFFLLLGCSGPPEGASHIIKVGDSALTAEVLATLVLQHPSSDSIFASRQAVVRWVTRELLYQAAVDGGMTENTMIEKQVNEFRKQRYGAAFLDTYLSSSAATNVSPEELRNHYMKNRHQYLRHSDSVKMLHFLLPQHSVALEVKSKLLRYDGESRLDLLNNYRVEAAVVSPQDLREELRSVVFGPKAGRGVFGPILGSRGYHVIEVLARYRAQTYQGLDEVYDVVVQSVLREKGAVLYTHLMDSLTSRHLSGASPGFNIDWGAR